MSQIFNTVMRSIDHLGYSDFLIIFAVAVAIGVIALRGFGSRTNY